MQSILVTGATGFLGYHVTDMLEKSRYTVFTAGRSTLNRSGHIICNLANDELNLLLPKVDAVIHLAAHAPIPMNNDPQINITNNTIATFNLLEWARLVNVRYFLYTSSLAVYNNNIESPVKETDPADPSTFYGLSKLLAEDLCSFYSKFMAMTTLRLGYVYGQGVSDRSVFNVFIQKCLKGEQLTIKNSGLDVWDFVYIDDILQAIMNSLYLSHDLTLLNIGSGQPRTTRDLAKITQKITMQGNIIVEEAMKEYKPNGIYADISLARELIDYRPQFTLERGMQKLISGTQKEH